MIDLTRRRFLFGLAAAPLVVPAVKHFVMPRFEFETEQKHTIRAGLPEPQWRKLWQDAYDRAMNPPMVASWADDEPLGINWDLSQKLAADALAHFRRIDQMMKDRAWIEVRA